MYLLGGVLVHFEERKSFFKNVTLLVFHIYIMNTKVSRKPRNTTHFNLFVFLGFYLTFVFTYIIFSKLVIIHLYFLLRSNIFYCAPLFHIYIDLLFDNMLTLCKIQSSTINIAATSEINLEKNFRNFVKPTYF